MSRSFGGRGRRPAGPDRAVPAGPDRAVPERAITNSVGPTPDRDGSSRVGWGSRKLDVNTGWTAESEPRFFVGGRDDI